MSAGTHHLDHEPFTGDSWCVECQTVFATRAGAEAHAESTVWVDRSCRNCTPCRDAYGVDAATYGGD